MCLLWIRANIHHSKRYIPGTISRRGTSGPSSMSGEPHHSDPRFYERDYALDRLIMLSDGVFAIAMTLMALEVRPPGQWEHTLSGLADAIAGPFIAFFWSFFGTAIFWTTHRRLFARFTRSNAVVTSLNLVLLGQVTLIPVATRMIGELAFIHDALFAYLALYALIGTMFAIMHFYIWHTGIMSPPRPGPAETAYVISLAVLPVGMTSLGVLSMLPRLHWLPFLMPPVMVASRLLRRLAEAVDKRRKKEAVLF
jgi:uncharacterized membrane protein